jgi:hypothetical protein
LLLFVLVFFLAVFFCFFRCLSSSFSPCSFFFLFVCVGPFSLEQDTLKLVTIGWQLWF